MDRAPLIAAISYNGCDSALSNHDGIPMKYLPSRGHRMSVMTRRITSLSLVVAIAAAVLGATAFVGQGAKPEASLASGGLDGSKGRMQGVTLPAKTSRFAYVPGTNGRQAWAIGHITSKKPGWDSAPTGQIVFLSYEGGQRWKVQGPPVDDAQNPTNPTLANLSMAANGEGWAVGSQGALVHLTPGGRWTYRSACPSVMPANDCSDLVGVSIKQVGSDVVGFAVGRGGRVLRLSQGEWQIDNRPLIPTSQSPPDLVGVATINSEDAWAVGNSSSRELQLFRRGTVSWDRKFTGKPIFDSPAPSTEGSTINLAAVGSSMVATDSGEVWAGGGIYPVNAGEPLGDPQSPFTINIKNETNMVTYCPVQYALAGDNVEPTDICTASMPISKYDISSLSATPNGEIFAGGTGLFHFKSSVWFREPDAIGRLSNVAFASPSEGWVASTGDTIESGGPARSSTLVAGHYTSTPTKARTVRWPHFNTKVLQGIAVSPDGRKAIAVGNNGTAVYYEQGVGWDALSLAGLYSIRGVAWRSNSEAWAVGERGFIYRFDGKNLKGYDLGSATTKSLFGVAFDRQGVGYAVGTSGTILRFAGGSWSQVPSPTSSTLYDIAANGDGFTAVGADGTLLTNHGGGGGWQRDDAVRDLLSRPNTPLPAIYGVSMLPDGTTFAGGAGGSLIRREPSGSLSLLDPIDAEVGTILDIAARKDPSGTLHMFASVSPDAAKYVSERVGAGRSSLLHNDGSGWMDIQLNRRITTWLDGDSSAKSDPILSIAIDSTGTSGWGVGGTMDGLTDEEQHLASTPSSAIYRFDLRREPAAPGSTISPTHDGPGFTFAFVSETGCGSGPCSLSVGSGIMADEVLLQVRDQVNAYSRLPNGPKFVIFGGNLRWRGQPEDLAAFKGYISEFEIPVFAAMGPSDLFSAEATAGALGLAPEPDDSLNVIFDPSTTQQSVATSNRFFLRTFADEHEPWGTLDRSTCNARYNSCDIRPVDVLADGTSGLARTYYAFDYAPKGGRALARFVILDTSDKAFAKGAATNQNPPRQDQSTAWFTNVVSGAVTSNPPIPTFVAMNVPTINPTSLTSNRDRRGALVDGPTFESQALALGVSAVFSGLYRSNSLYNHPDDLSPKKLPFYIMGSGGAPLGGTKFPSDGHYPAWHMINFDSSAVSITNPQANVQVTTIPVIESVALHAVNGLFAPGGTTLNFQGLGRSIEGGDPAGHSDQSRRTYTRFPAPFRCPESTGPGRGDCTAQSALLPDYHFTSDDPTVAQFVAPGPIAGLPLVLNGFLVPDDKSGFLCTFKFGKTNVRLTSGIRQAIMPVSVGAGEGPCVKYPVLAPPKVPIPGTLLALLRPDLAPGPTPGHKPLFKPPLFPDPLAVVLPPAPGPIAAPAPPGSAATSRKEEEEHQSQSEGQEGDNEARVMFHASRQDPSEDTLWGWYVLTATLIMGFSGALAVASITKRQPKPNYVSLRR